MTLAGDCLRNGALLDQEDACFWRCARAVLGARMRIGNIDGAVRLSFG